MCILTDYRVMCVYLIIKGYGVFSERFLGLSKLILCTNSSLVLYLKGIHINFIDTSRKLWPLICFTTSESLVLWKQCTKIHPKVNCQFMVNTAEKVKKKLNV